MMNTLFNKLPGENEKCVFYFKKKKTEGILWPIYFLKVLKKKLNKFTEQLEWVHN